MSVVTGSRPDVKVDIGWPDDAIPASDLSSDTVCQ